MAKVSDKAVDRSKGGNLLPGGSITGNLYEIVDDINDSMKNVEAGIDLIFNGNVDSQKSFSEFINAFNETRSQASEEFMSMMGFVSGGQTISKNTNYSSIKTNIQSFTKKIQSSLDTIKNIQEIIDPGKGMKVISVNNVTDNSRNNNANVKLSDLNLGEDSLKVLKDLSNALNSVAKVKYEVKDQNIVQYLTGINKSISKD